MDDKTQSVNRCVTIRMNEYWLLEFIVFLSGFEIFIFMFMQINWQ